MIVFEWEDRIIVTNPYKIGFEKDAIIHHID